MESMNSQPSSFPNNKPARDDNTIRTANPNAKVWNLLRPSMFNFSTNLPSPKMSWTLTERLLDEVRRRLDDLRGGIKASLPAFTTTRIPSQQSCADRGEPGIQSCTSWSEYTFFRHGNNANGESKHNQYKCADLLLVH